MLARPCVADLSFQAFDRPVHPEWIDALVTRAFERDGYRLKLHLTPAGHVVQWSWGKTSLVEVLADQSQPLPDQRQLFAHRVGGERSENYTLTEKVSYQTCFQLERMAPEVFLHFHDDLQRDGRRDGVLHLLSPADRMGLSPVSYVDVQARSGSLLIHVYHTYPAEFAVVKSQTLIETAG